MLFNTDEWFLAGFQEGQACPFGVADDHRGDGRVMRAASNSMTSASDNAVDDVGETAKTPAAIDDGSNERIQLECRRLAGGKSTMAIRCRATSAKPNPVHVELVSTRNRTAGVDEGGEPLRLSPEGANRDAKLGPEPR